MAVFELHSKEADVKIDEHASEIHSFCDHETNLEYMWQGDPAYWSGRNPTLFPMVGSTWDKKLHINGKEYTTGNHGFARHSDFKCIEYDETHAVMQLKDNEETRKQYPFSFVLENSYSLYGKTITISSSVTNASDVIMPFNHGFHPAFRCPLEEGRTQKDYSLFFSRPETFTAGGKKFENVKEIALDPDLLDATIILTAPKSTDFTLSDGVHGVTVHAAGYPWVAFWSPKAPFVCIEPWHSHTDFEKTEVPFEKREGTILLDPGKTWSTEYSITIF